MTRFKTSLMFLFVGGGAAVAPLGCGAARTSDDTQATASEVTSAVVVYDGALTTGWLDESFVTHSLVNTTPVAHDSHSISASFTPWSGLHFSNAGVSTVGLATLDFEVNGGANTAPAIDAYAWRNGAPGSPVSVAPYCAGGAIASNAWTTCHVPLSAFGALGPTMDGIELQEGAGRTLSPMYFDVIQLGASSLVDAGTSTTPDASSPTTGAWIYRDAMVSPWVDESWASHSLTSTSPVATGTDAISVTMGAWQALYFVHPGFSTVGHSTLSMMVNGGASGAGVALRVRTMVNGAFTTGVVLGATCVGGMVPKNAWARCDVPLSSIAPVGATITGVVIQEDAGDTLPTISFDEIGFDEPSTSPPDAGVVDSGAADAGANDAATKDVGVVDTGTTDTATTDVGTPDAGTTASTWVSGYYAGYQSSMYPTSQVDFTAITHLLVAGVTPNADGTLNTTFYIDAVNGPALAEDLTTRAHAAGRKAIMMVGGAGSLAGWQGAASTTHRAAFVANLLSTMKSLGFDGLDLDWEPVAAADEPTLLALAQAIRAADPGIILTVPVTWVGAYSGADSFYATLAPSIDQMNIMSYQMADAWSGWQSWYSAALAGQSVTTPSSVSSSATAYEAAGVPKSKIGIGIGFYGSCWTGVTGARQTIGSGSVVAGDNVMTYAHILADYYSTSAYQWDPAASVGSLSFSAAHGPEGCTWVSYEDDASIAAKGAWVRSNGFGGTIVWTINQGYVAATASNPPLESVKKAFLE